MSLRLIASVAIGLCLSTSCKGGGTFQWTGMGTSDFWTSDNNWFSPDAIGDTPKNRVDPGGVIEFQGDARTTNTNNRIDSAIQIRFESDSNFIINSTETVPFILAPGAIFRNGNAVPLDPAIQNMGADDGAGSGTINFSLAFTTAQGASASVGWIDAVAGDISINGDVALLSSITSLYFNGAGDHTSTINGSISGESKNLIVNGGRVLLLKQNIYSGGTTINGGILQADAANALKSTSSITVNAGGTLILSGNSTIDRVNDAAPITLSGGTIAKAVGASEGSSGVAGLGALTLQASSTLDFTGTAGTLTFSDFIPGRGLILSVANYIGNGAPQGVDQLIFQTDQVANLHSFDFGFGPGVNVTEMALNSGFFEVYPVTAVPEVKTWIAGLLSLLVIGWNLIQRRKAFAGTMVSRFLRQCRIVLHYSRNGLNGARIP